MPARTLNLLDLEIEPVAEGFVDTIDVSNLGKPQFRKTSPKPLAWMVMRDRFDQHLSDAAVQSGAVLRDRRPVQSVIEAEDSVSVETAGGTERAQWLIAADGTTGPAARQLGIPAAPTRSAAYELEVAAPRSALEHWTRAANVDVGYRPWGYGWVFPKQGKLSVGVVTAPKRGRGIRRHAEQYLSKLGREDAEIEKVQGHPIRYRRSTLEPVAGGNALLVGDAAGLADEFTAEGIAYAVHSAQLAAEAVLGDRDTARSYTAAVNREIQPELNAARTISRLYYWCVTTWPWLALTVSNAINYLWRAFFRVMRGESTYAAELSRLPGNELVQRTLC